MSPPVALLIPGYRSDKRPIMAYVGSPIESLLLTRTVSTLIGYGVARMVSITLMLAIVTLKAFAQCVFAN